MGKLDRCCSCPHRACSLVGREDISLKVQCEVEVVGDGGAQVEAGYRRKQMKLAGRLGQGSRAWSGDAYKGGHLLIC